MGGFVSRPFAPLLGVAVLLTACGSTATTGSSPSSTGLSATSALYPYRNLACEKMAACGRTSSQMKFTLSPDHGPPGTLVTLKVAGCNDPGGGDHSLVYDATSIASNLRGQSLSGSYRVGSSSPAVGRFAAQCLDTTVYRQFTVTN